MTPATDTKRPKVIKRKGGKRLDTMTNNLAHSEVDAMVTTPAEQSTATATTINNDIGAPTTAPDPTPTTTSLPPLPPLPGFSLDGASRNQSYAIRNMLVFADCCVGHTEDEIFDVIARNYSDTGSVCWWLFRIGKGDLVPRLKGKDLVDAARIVAHVLHRQLKKEVGLRIPRW